jgi:xylitol oxidase
MVTTPGPITRPTNWAGNVTFTADAVHEPQSVGELQDLLAGSARIRAIGTGHSFNRVADSDRLVSVRRLPALLEVDAAARTVRVGAGTRYGELGAALQAAGYALANTGSLPHISIGGAVSTGTHGSGVTNQWLGAQVRELTLVRADGELVRVSRQSAGETFDGHVLALGRLGVMTELVLDIEPAYDVAQTVIVEVSDDCVAGAIGPILSAAYSVSIFTTWDPDRNRIWVKQRTDRPTTWAQDPPWDGRPAEDQQHPVPGELTGSATEQLGVPGSWNERMPHFRLAFVPSAGDELQSEFFVPAAHAAAGWTALTGMREALRPVILVSEIRAVAGDPSWLSLTAGMDSVAFHFTWRPDAARVEPVVSEVERRLAPFGARPHWGKVFTTSPDRLAELYPRLPDVRRLVRSYDPQGRLGNELVDGWLGLTG